MPPVPAARTRLTLTDQCQFCLIDRSGVNQWPSIVSGTTAPRTLPTTHKSLLVDDGEGHMFKLINGNETRADRFHANGSVYEDPFHPCLPGHNANGTYGMQCECLWCGLSCSLSG
jgi:hypothetical protein